MKKAQSLPFSTIVIIIILIVVAVAVIFIFRNYIQKEADYVGLQLSGLDDCDCDGAPDFVDECDFDPSYQKKPAVGTCRTGTDETQCVNWQGKDEPKSCPTLS